MNTDSEYSLLDPLNFNFTSNVSYNFNDTSVLTGHNLNFTLYDDIEDEPQNFTLYLNSSDDISIEKIPEKNYWALILILFPILTLFGNILVIGSVYRERTLQTVTNYFIVSLALADLLVAVVVMPFAVYVLVSFLIYFNSSKNTDRRKPQNFKFHCMRLKGSLYAIFLCLK